MNMRHRFRLVLWVGVLLGGSAAWAGVQDPAEPKPAGEQRETAKRRTTKSAGDKAPSDTPPKRARPGLNQDTAKDVQSEMESSGTPAAATIERIMDQAVRNISVRYNLNKAQSEETHRLMRREVLRFIQEHESEVWPVVRDLLSSQLGASPPNDPSELNRIGKGARPLLKLAKEATFRANEEWRLILNAEQRRTHQFDMEEMDGTFKEIDHRFSEWEAGRAPAEGLFPQPRLTGREPPRPSKPPEGLPEPEIEVFNPATVFEKLVEEFIKDYELTEGQITSARSILEEFKGKASDFRATKKEDFARIAAEQQQAAQRRDIEGIRKAASENKKLLGPVYELSDQMEDRLLGLLDSAQIQRYEEKHKPGPKAAAAKETKRTEPPAPTAKEEEIKPAAPPAKNPPSSGSDKSDSQD